MDKEALIAYFNGAAATRDRWRKRNWYYHKALETLAQFLIPSNQSVLEIGCGTGELLMAIKPSRGVGVDISPAMIAQSQEKYPQYEWRVDDAENLKVGERFDYVIASDLIGYVDDIEEVFYNLNRVCHPRTRVVITHYNHLWEPVLRLAERLGLKAKQPLQNWMSGADIENMLELAGFEVVKRGKRMICPFWIPLLSNLINRYVGQLPLLSRLGVIQYYVARQVPQDARDYSVSVVIPCRNECGNIENAVKRVPQFGTYMELIFVEKGSTDGTLEEIKRVASAYAGKKNIRWFEGDIDSKRDKVRLAFAKAKGDILMILDADLTMPPEDLPKFYRAIASGRGEFINGSRLVYPMEKEAMRFLNMLANKFFSLMFTWLLGQRIKDTLCGTKVIFRKDYEVLAANRAYFGDFDPFGDFDLLFGAAKLNLKIVELPVRYRARTYGKTNIHRWRHGWILLTMVAFAMRKIKFI